MANVSVNNEVGLTCSEERTCEMMFCDICSSVVRSQNVGYKLRRISFLLLPRIRLISHLLINN